MRERAEEVARDLARGHVRVEPGKAKLVETRNNVRQAWWAVSDILIQEKQPDLAAQVRRFADQMPAVMTDKEYLAARLLEQQRGRNATQDVSVTPLRFTPPHRSR
jgi:hypothetical protein